MKRYVAELVGTFVLVFGGCGSAVLAGDKIGFAGVSFAFGLSLLAMVYANRAHFRLSSQPRRDAGRAPQ
jgi:aquaporin Z